LPQLWVSPAIPFYRGPRAYVPSELDEMDDYAPVILRIQPGLTGWRQVMGRHGTTFEQRLRMDEEHQQRVVVDGLLYPDENSLGGFGREGGVDENQFFMPRHRLW